MSTTPDAAQMWQRLCAYYTACVAAEGEGEVMRAGAEGTQFVVVGRGLGGQWPGEIHVDAGLGRLIRAAQEAGGSIRIGYPIAVVDAASHSGRADLIVTPVITTSIDPPPKQMSIPSSIHAGGDELQASGGLLQRWGAVPEQVADLCDAAAGGVGAALDRIGEALGADTTLRPVDDDAPLARLNEGVWDVAIAWVGAGDAYTRALLSDLTWMGKHWDAIKGTAAARLLDPPILGDAPGGYSRRAPMLLAPMAMNAAQEEAIHSSLADGLVAVTGPPGTGKSQFVGDLVASVWVKPGGSVLVASTNNQAVDVACERLREVAPALLVRTGSAERRAEARHLLDLLPSTQATCERTAEVRADVGREWGGVRRATQALEEQERRDIALSRLIGIREAGAVRADVRLDTIAGWSATQVHDWRDRAARINASHLFPRWRGRRLVRRITGRPGDLAPVVEVLHTEAHYRELRSLSTLSSARLLQQLRRTRRRFVEVSRDLCLRYAAAAVVEGTHALVDDVGAVNEYGRGRGRAFRRILEVLPAWATTALAAGNAIPMVPGLFDLVVIDEASQCSIAASLPLLARARRAVVVGDPRQLTHVTTVPPRLDEQILVRSGLDLDWTERSRLRHGAFSIYHAVEARTPARHLLNEHYRSRPEIIGLANTIFYGGALQVLSDPEALSSGAGDALAWVDVPGRAARPGEGGSLLNESEAVAVVDVVSGLLAASSWLTVGVVTPFRAQARRIRAEMQHRLSEEALVQIGSLERAVGTVHTFQGSERDIMVFSAVISADAPESGRRFLRGNDELLNVALTRARRRFIGVGDVAACRAVGGSLRRIVDAAVTGGDEVGAALRRHELDSDAEARVFALLVQSGAVVTPKARWHHIEMDMLLEVGGRRIDVEIDGAHHHLGSGLRRSRDMARDDLLESHGYAVMRYPDWRCRADPGAVVAELLGGAR